MLLPWRTSHVEPCEDPIVPVVASGAPGPCTPHKQPTAECCEGVGGEVAGGLELDPGEFGGQVEEELPYGHHALRRRGGEEGTPMRERRARAG